MKTTISLTASIASATLLIVVACGGASHDGSIVSMDSEVAQAPTARIKIEKDVYHGVPVEDPYRWLEGWNDVDVREWSDGQNAFARRKLNSLPERAWVHSRITEILKSARSVIYFDVCMLGDDTMLAIKRDPGKQHSTLVMMNSDAEPASERVLVDPNELDPSHLTSIDWYQPSHSGSLVAVSMSSGGSEAGDIHVFDITNGEQVDVQVERVNGGTAGGDLAWFADDSGFYYTRYPRPGERPEEELLFYQQIWQHKLGTSADDDQYVLGKNFPRVAMSRLFVDPQSGRLLVWTQDGDSSRFEMNLRQQDGTWTKFSEFGDGIVQAAFGPNDVLYVLDRATSPRGRLLRLSASEPRIEQAIEIVPQQEMSISHSFYFKFAPTFLVTADRLYVVYEAGGPTELVAYSLDGEKLEAPVQEPISAVDGLTPVGESDLVFSTSSYTTTPQWYRYSASDNETTHLTISSDSPVDYSDVEVIREFATSKDGSSVPVNILIPRGVSKYGKNAIVVTGYGGYGISVRPFISMSRHILFENGVIFAEANLRGGGEYGEEWHLQGNLTRKQNVFDDFIAVIEHLIAKGYADPNRVAIVGGSNGGLLMGATITQNPSIATVAVSHVGIYDMLRAEQDPNGEFNVPEFGSVKVPEQFRALYAYSPYHNVEDGVTYPPILLTTGANDTRVNPAHSRKFAARLQSAQKSGGLVLLRTSGETGHGLNTPLHETIELLTDQYAFIFHYLRVHLDVP